jgi:hypothetical protein
VIKAMVTLPGGKQIPSRKRCTRCKRVRLLKSFCRSTAGYYSSHCRDCHAGFQAQWVKKNPKKFAKVFQRYYAKLKKLGVKRIRDLKKKKKRSSHLEPK